VLAEPFDACLPVLRLFRELGVDCYVGGYFAARSTARRIRPTPAQDVLGVLKTQRENLDLGYLDSMAKQLEIQDRWRRAAENAGFEAGFEQSE
jgi:hypothetical protein